MSRKSKSIYEVPLSIVLLLLIIYLISKEPLLIIIALILGILALLSTTVSKAITISWLQAMRVLGFINAHILLTLIFFVILVPIAFIYRLFKKDSLNLKPGKDSYFVERNHRFVPKDLKNPW